MDVKTIMLKLTVWSYMQSTHLMKFLDKLITSGTWGETHTKKSYNTWSNMGLPKFHGQQRFERKFVSC